MNRTQELNRLHQEVVRYYNEIKKTSNEQKRAQLRQQMLAAMDKYEALLAQSLTATT